MEYESKMMYQYWTKSSIDCYKRGCNCKGCLMPEILETRCHMKQAVFELVRKFGAPKQNEPHLTEAQQKVVNAILNGRETHDDIAEYVGLNKANIRTILSGLYRVAELDGAMFMDIRHKLKDLVLWVRGEYEEGI